MADLRTVDSLTPVRLIGIEVNQVVIAPGFKFASQSARHIMFGLLVCTELHALGS